jgi:hypothetical protein
MDLDHTRQLIGAWLTDYNTARPHFSLGYKTPAIQCSVSLHAPKGAIRRWMKVRWQVRVSDSSGISLTPSKRLTAL